MSLIKEDLLHYEIFMSKTLKITVVNLQNTFVNYAYFRWWFFELLVDLCSFFFVHSRGSPNYRVVSLYLKCIERFSMRLYIFLLSFLNWRTLPLSAPPLNSRRETVVPVCSPWAVIQEWNNLLSVYQVMTERLPPTGFYGRWLGRSKLYEFELILFGKFPSLVRHKDFV